MTASSLPGTARRPPGRACDRRRIRLPGSPALRRARCAAALAGASPAPDLAEAGRALVLVLVVLAGVLL